jgi:cation transport ATPase
LTEGKFGVKQIYTDGVDKPQALVIAASLESLSEHPLGQSLALASLSRESFTKQIAVRVSLSRRVTSKLFQVKALKV